MHSAHRGVLRIAVGTEPATLNPVHVQLISESFFEEAIFDGLLKFDPTGRLLPDLATIVPSRANGGISSDFRTITYHLRRGVVWHDGAPFTSQDVAFTYRLHADPHGSSAEYSLYKQIDKLETPDAYTVRVRLKKPSVAALTDLFAGESGKIVPEHLLAHVADLRKASFSSHPIGTGPYRLAKWEHGNDIQLVANPRYFAGPPSIQKITVRFVPSSTSRALLLERGEIDVTSLSSQDVVALKKVPSVVTMRARTFDVFFIEFNLKKKAVADRAVRQGLAYAIDHLQLMKALNGTGVPAVTLLPPGSWAFDAKNGCPTFDLHRARALLGRTKEPLHLELDYVSGVTMENLSVLLQQQWKAAGVETTLHARPLNELFGERGILDTGTFQVAIDEERLPQSTDMVEVLDSRQKPPEGYNASLYTNHDVDRWLAAAQETDDIESRRTLYAKVQRAVCRDVPIIPLYWDTRFYGVNRALRNFKPNIVTSDLWNVATWSWQ